MKRKVTSLTAAVLCIILLALDSYIYFTLHRHVMSLENSLITNRAKTISQSMARLNDLEFSPMGLDYIHRQLQTFEQRGQGESVMVLDQNFFVVGHTGRLTVQSMLSGFNANNLLESGLTKVSTAWYMTVAVPIYSPDGDPIGVTVVWDNIQKNEDYLHTLLIALILGSLGAVLLAAAGGYAISAAAARPIDHMIRLVDRIQAGKINERIPLPSGTDEVARLAATFNQMLDRIERSFQQQAQFVADASHEIRTPLTTIHGYAGLLGRWGKQDPAVVEKAIQVIQKESVRLRTLTNDMLTLADMESSQQALTRTCEINQTTTDVLEPYELLHPEHPIAYQSLAEACWIAMAPEHYGRVLTNLVDNAIKYTEPGGQIGVSIQREALFVTVSVSDTGQGIPEEDLPRIFDRFYRVDKARSRVAGGNGLGLAIVRELIELYGGEISATSTVNAGTTVRFRLPLANPV